MPSKRTDKATAARKVPDGWQNIKVTVRVPDSAVDELMGMSSVERGEVWMKNTTESQMEVSQFSAPDKHPYELLERYTNANQKEGNLVYFLIESIKAGEWVAVTTKYDQSEMVKDGLLIDCGKTEYEFVYRLTTKAKRLLYSVYGKD
jgi:hypothetical protein